MNRRTGLIDKKLIEDANDVAKNVKTLVKHNTELLDLVCFMRKMLDDCMITKNGMTEQIDFSNKKLDRAFTIMMEVQHEKDILKELKRQEKTDNLHVEGVIAFDGGSEPTIDAFYDEEEI
tara:strand:- start:35760 stop:36119 length:360 start_codon:yes stop_codon:yes gene_type:complete